MALEDERKETILPEQPQRAVVNGLQYGDSEKAAEAETNVQDEARRPAPLFWPSGVTSEMVWHLPPLALSPEEQMRQEALLNELGGFCSDLPRRFWLLKWNYWTRALAATQEQRAVEQEVQGLLEELKRDGESERALLDRQIAEAYQRESELRAQLVQERQRFAERVARAGIRVPDGLFRQESPSVSRADKEPATPWHTHPLAHLDANKVIEALEEIPETDEIAGENGLRPSEQQGFFALLLNLFMQLLAPLVAGLLLAICLGTLVGLLDLDTLLRADGLPRLGVAAALGFVVVYLMGEIYHAAVGMLGRSLERYEGSAQAPRLSGQMAVALLAMGCALVLGLSEVTAEGMGLRMLHRQQLLREERILGTQGHGLEGEMPLPIYMLIGLLISGPYLLYKSVKGWSDAEEQMRSAWLRHRQRVFMEEHSKDPAVQELLQSAYTIEGLEKSIWELRYELKALQQRRLDSRLVTLPEEIRERRQAARAAAVGEADRFQRAVEQLIEAAEPLPLRETSAQRETAKRNGFFANRW